MVSIADILKGRHTGESVELRGEGELHLAEATTFETGANEWKQYDAWPPKSAVQNRRLYFREDRRLSFDAPAAGAGGRRGLRRLSVTWGQYVRSRRTCNSTWVIAATAVTAVRSVRVGAAVW